MVLFAKNGMIQNSKIGSTLDTGPSWAVERMAKWVMGCRLGRRLVTALFLCALFAPDAQSAEDAAREYRLKAGFLYQFTRYVEWPTNATPTTNSPIVIGVLAEDQVAPIVREQLDGQIASGRPIIVRLLPDASAVTNCHMLFLSRAQKDRVDQLLAQSQGRPILTVGELDQFAQRGGVINFVRKGEYLRLQVNLEAAQEASLKISAKLAKMADVVKPRR